MFDEQHWLAWAAQQRSLQVGVSGLDTVSNSRGVAPVDASQIATIHRGVVELKRRNSSLCEQLLTHYGVTGRQCPDRSRSSRYGSTRAQSDPRIDVAKRWVSEWARENAY